MLILISQIVFGWPAGYESHRFLVTARMFLLRSSASPECRSKLRGEKYISCSYHHLILEGNAETCLLPVIIMFLTFIPCVIMLSYCVCSCFLSG